MTHDPHPHPHDHASTVAGPHSTPLDAAAEVIDRNLLLFRWGAYATAAGCVVVALFAAKRMPLFAVARTPAELAALTSPVSPAGRLRRAWVCLEGSAPVAAAAEAEHAESAASAASAAAARPVSAAAWERTAVPVVAVRHVPLLAAWVLPRSRQTAWAGPPLHVSPYALAPSSTTEARAIEDTLLLDYGVGPRGRLLAATVCELRPAADDEAAELAVCKLHGRRQGHLRRQDASHATLATGQSAFDHEALLRAEQWPGAPQWRAGLESLRGAEAAARLAGRGRWREDAVYARPVPRLSGGLRAAWDQVAGAVRRWMNK